MTEANSDYLTPIVLICSLEHDQLSLAKDQAVKKFGSLPEEQLTVINQTNETIPIDRVRTLATELSFGSFRGKTRHICILHAEKATAEAQNALLKLLEEPPSQTQMWLVTDRPTLLLPTMLSRCEEWRVAGYTHTSLDSDTHSLLTSLPQLSHRELCEKAEDFSERPAALKLMVQLLSGLHGQLQTSQTYSVNEAIHTVLQTQKYLEANTNVRLTVEHCFFELKRQLSRESGH